jgi:hypothetical protein
MQDINNEGVGEDVLECWRENSPSIIKNHGFSTFRIAFIANVIELCLTMEVGSVLVECVSPALRPKTEHLPTPWQAGLPFYHAYIAIAPDHGPG